jgi:dTMP kinase
MMNPAGDLMDYSKLEGKFITFEGGEGSGKTTQIQYIAGLAEEHGIDCLVTREPGGTDIGRKIRAVLLDSVNNELTPLAELLLYSSDRAVHVQTFLRPSLKEGKLVLCDRYFDSTTVYQGYAGGLDIGVVMKMNDIASDGLTPDLTFYLDIHPEIGIKRSLKQLAKSDLNESRFEEKTIQYHKRVQEGFHKLAESHPDRFRVIDASPAKETVSGHIKKILEDYTSSLR